MRRSELQRRTRVVSPGSSWEAAIRDLGSDEIPVAAGGDGTVNRLVSALRAAGRAGACVGVIPLGTGNTFAFSIGIRNFDDAAVALTDRHMLAVDVMVTTDAEYPLALVSISTGFESHLIGSVAATRGWRRHARAPLSIARAATKTFRDIELHVDGRRVTPEARPVFSAGLYNTPYYGRGRVVIPNSRSTDGVAEAVVHANRRSYLGSLVKGIVQKRATPGSAERLYSWTDARIRSPHGMQLDGEAVNRSSFDVRLEPRGLTVLTLSEAHRE